MRGLLRGLLEYSQADRAPLRVAKADLGVIMEHALANLRQSLVDTNAIVHCGSLPQVKCDQSQMVQLFQNVIGNALKFARPNVVPAVHISSTQAHDGVVVAVRDNGIGIAENNGKRVFEIFGRLHPVDVFPGSGVGLAVCKKIVDRHGGRIWYESSPNEGTTFFVEFPKDKK